jgi:hypothetical protein
VFVSSFAIVHTLPCNQPMPSVSFKEMADLILFSCAGKNCEIFDMKGGVRLQYSGSRRNHNGSVDLFPTSVCVAH